MCFLTVIGCLKPTTEFETLRKDPKLVSQFVKDGIISTTKMQMFILLIIPLLKLKHMVGVFVQSLKVSGWPQIASPSLKAHQRCQLLGMPQGICGEPGRCRA